MKTARYRSAGVCRSRPANIRAAIRTTHAGEALFQIAAAEVLVDRFADDGPAEPEAGLGALKAGLLEALVVLLDEAQNAVSRGRRGR